MDDKWMIYGLIIQAKPFPRRRFPRLPGFHFLHGQVLSGLHLSEGLLRPALLRISGGLLATRHHRGKPWGNPWGKPMGKLEFNIKRLSLG